MAAASVLCCLSSLGLAPVVHAEPIAVIVNADVPVEDLAFAELRRIMRGDRKFWSAGNPIKLIVGGKDTEERGLLLDDILKMNEAQFRQHWIAKVFRAEATAEPLVAGSNDEAVELAGVLDGAITLVKASDVPSGLKVVRVDGLKPGDSGYRLNSPER